MGFVIFMFHGLKMGYREPADSFPITRVTFCFCSMAAFRADFACVRKWPRGTLEMVIF